MTAGDNVRRCGVPAKTTGKPCRNTPVGGCYGTRCRMHGGTSGHHLRRVEQAYQDAIARRALVMLRAQGIAGDGPSYSLPHMPARGWSKDRTADVLNRHRDRIQRAQPLPVVRAPQPVSEAEEQAFRRGFLRGAGLPDEVSIQGIGYAGTAGEGFGWPVPVAERPVTVADAGWNLMLYTLRP